MLSQGRSQNVNRMAVFFSKLLIGLLAPTRTELATPAWQIGADKLSGLNGNGGRCQPETLLQALV